MAFQRIIKPELIKEENNVPPTFDRGKRIGIIIGTRDKLSDETIKVLFVKKVRVDGRIERCAGSAEENLVLEALV